jgi:hypothetical protein
MRLLLLAVLLPLGVTGGTLATVSWNRSGGRDAIVLSDRELALRSPSDENSGRSMWIRHQGGWWGGEAWLTPAKLASLGFDTTVDAASPDAEAHYRRALRRDVFVALELDGPAWHAWVRTYEENMPQWSPEGEMKRTFEEGSRLVPVDAALEAATLAAKYPDAGTHLIARGVVRVMLHTPGGERPRISGVVEALTPDTLHMPAHLGKRLGARPYRVSVRYGRRYEPWIVGVEP